MTLSQEAPQIAKGDRIADCKEDACKFRRSLAYAG